MLREHIIKHELTVTVHIVTDALSSTPCKSQVQITSVTKEIQAQTFPNYFNNVLNSAVDKHA